MPVPYTFATATGNLPLNELDANFNYVLATPPAFAISARIVTQNSQPSITSLGTLANLSVTGNITSATNVIGQYLYGNGIYITGLPAQYGNSNVANYLPVYPGVINCSLLSSVGNVQGAYIIGNLSFATDPNTSKIFNGTSFANINTNNGNLSVTIDGQPNVAVFSSTGLGLNGTLSVTGDVTFDSNLYVAGTTTTIDSQTLNVADKNITVANNVGTSLLINGAGIDAGNPVVAYIRYTDASKGWTTANNFAVGGNLSVTGDLSVTGAGAFTGVVTAPTAANGTSNTQIATTSFVGSAVINGLATIGTNAQGNRTVSASAPTGGNDGDIWYQI